MTPDIQAIKESYRRLLAEGAKEGIIELLTPVLRSPASLPAEDVGWAYWNVCDNYALLRKAREQLAYQTAFYEWSRAALPAHQWHWVVSDGTQAMTLISGGYLDFWWNCYRDANERAPQAADNRTVRFESHRANAAAYTRFREFGHAKTALQSLEALLAEDPLWVNRDFATVTWMTLLIEYDGTTGASDQVARHLQALEQYLGEWRGRWREPEAQPAEPLLGSWAQLNREWPAEGIFVAMHNAACGLAVARAFQAAERLFRQYVAARPAKISTYGRAMYLLARWHNRRDADEIHGVLAGLDELTTRRVLQFAPELSEALGGAERPNSASGT